jgi:hypothetical protein
MNNFLISSNSHCHSGMVFAINANADKTFDQYQVWTFLCDLSTSLTFY